MRNILLIIKSNLYRFSKEKLFILFILTALPIIVSLGIYFAQTDSIKGKIAVVGASDKEEQDIKKSIEAAGKITLEFLEESPTKTNLIKGIYIAEINLEKDNIEVISYGREEVKKSIESSIKGEVYEAVKDDTTIQGKIVGFLIMFLFTGSLMTMDFFLTDRENGAYVRVLSGRLTYYEYIIGQIVYNIILLTTPTLIMSLLVLKILSVELSISIGLFCALIFLIGLLSTAFSILICTVFKDKASATMSGSAISMISCLLGGCLINIVDNNKVIGFIRNLIPQKRLIDFANNYNNEDLIFLIVIITAFILISVVMGKKQYENGKFL